MGADVSGSDPIPVVDLLGTSMSALAFAIPAIVSRTGRQVVVIGGLAVVCRLSALTVSPATWTR